MSHRSALCIAVFCVRYTNMDAVVPSVRNSDFLLVGGMVEQWHEPSQRWRLDHRCRQLHVHNYTLSQVWGYQATQRACMVCSSISEVRHAATYRRWDHRCAPSPMTVQVFAANVAQFRAFGGWDVTLDGDAAFMDLFIRARGFGKGTGGQPRQLVGHCLQLQFERLNQCAVDPTGQVATKLYEPLGVKHGIASFSRDHRMQPDVDLCGSDVAAAGVVNPGIDGLATSPCMLAAMEALVLSVGDALASAGIPHAVRMRAACARDLCGVGNVASRVVCARGAWCRLLASCMRAR